MKSQFEDYPVDTVMILGIAGGNGLDEIHHQMESDVLNEKMNSIGFKLILKDMTELPNSKALVRQDYQKMI